MKLLIASDDNTVVAIDNLDDMIEPSTSGVAFARVGDVLRAIRVAVAAVKPPTMSPERLEAMTAEVFAVASHAKALADRAPAGDTDAPHVLAMLTQLGLNDPKV